MTENNLGTDPAAQDQCEYPFGYDHGRMPLFLKVAWLSFMGLLIWYVVSFLLTSLGEELAG